jgi:hypothetical protein
MGAAGFGAVRTQDVWWLHQLTRGVKPAENQLSPLFADLEPIDGRQWAAV